MNPVLTWQQGWRYGLMGLPLAFVALPLYVLLPNHYARSFGVSLATLGAVLVAVRLFDTLIDPLLGRWADRLHTRPGAHTPLDDGDTSTHEATVCHPGLEEPAPGHDPGGSMQRIHGSRVGTRDNSQKLTAATGGTVALAGGGRQAHVLRWAAVAALLLCTGFGLLFFPPVALQANTTQVLLWLGATLLLTTVAFSALTILHQAWGARLGGDALYRSRVVAWREGLGLVGVIVASLAPVAFGMPVTVTLLVVASVGGWLAWRSGPTPVPTSRADWRDVEPPQVNKQVVIAGLTRHPGVEQHGSPRVVARGRLLESGMTAKSHADSTGVWLPWKRSQFRQLISVFMVNGIASAIPATLMLFFVQDRLQAPPSTEPLFLGSYFVCAALSIPLWLKLVPRLGLARTWGLGMLLSVAVFIFAAGLGTGDVTEFVWVCALSGVALGTDLALPAALLAGVIQHHGDQQQREGAYFGWWAFATKLNLALAAGVALPALGLLGYTPGATDPEALQTLTFAYCLLPCALKTLAAVLLYFLIIRKTP